MAQRWMGIGLLFLFALQQCAFPQTYPFRFYTTADGLSQSNVTALFQDAHGCVWFGTSGGVSRYDGDHFWSYRSGALRVLCMAEDSSGVLWMGTTAGLASLRYPDTTLRWIRSPGTSLPSDLVLALHTDRHNNLWAGTDRGLLCMESSGNQFVLNHAKGLLSDDVHSIVEDTDGTVLVGTAEGVQRVILDGRDAPQVTVLLRHPFSKLALLRSGDLLLSNVLQRSVSLWSRRHLHTLYNINQPGTGTYPTTFTDDLGGRIWIGTTGGIVVIDQRRATVITRKEGLENSFINVCLRDREGNLWFGTEGGAVKHPLEISTVYNNVTGLPEDHVIAIFADRQRNIWFGTYGGAARVGSDGSLEAFGAAEGLPHLSVHDFCEDASGHVWIGTFRGVRWYSQGSLRRTGNARLDTMRVVSLLREADGTILCGGEREILAVSPRGGVSALVDKRTIARSNVSALYRDAAGRVWFGTDDEGAGCIEGQNVRLYDQNAGLPDLWVMSITEDRHHQVWMTTQKGVVRWNGLRFEPIPVQDDALRNDAVTSVVRDSADHLWFGTQHGVYEWDDSLIGHWDGQSGIAADAVRRGYVDRDGAVWIGTVAGASRLDLKMLRSQSDPPAAEIAGIELSDAPGRVTQRADFVFDESTLVFHWNAVSFIDEQRTQFRWMLAGFDRVWQPAMNQRSVRYTHLPPGSYEFLVAAKNRGRVWSAPARLRFVINPPFWAKWWFVLGSTLLAAGVLVAIARRRMERLERERRRQKEFALQLMNSQENERKRIASELHDSLGQDLLVIRNRALLGLKEAGLAPTGRSQLEHISAVATEAINEVREISHNLRPYQLDRLGLTHAIQALARGVSESSAMQLRTHIEHIDGMIEPDGAIHVYRILQEAVTNMLKHSGATEARLEVCAEGKGVRITIADNGRGFAKDALVDTPRGSGMGLLGISERVNVLHGSIAVETAPGNGTTLTVHIPRRNS